MTTRYALYGLAGYVANRHLKAIKDTGGELIAATDPHDSVGLVDAYFPNCEFFTDEWSFQQYCADNKPDYMVVCSPNYLHKSQAKFGMTIGSDIICEKPIVLYPSDLAELVNTELKTGKRVYTILQLRLKPELQGLRCELENSGNYHHVEIDYITPRGKWYAKTWKADIKKSGGLFQNIGIHLFDLMIWMFGEVKDIELTIKTHETVAGSIYLESAKVDFNLSISGKEPKRKIVIGNRKVEFSKGFTELHTYSYQKILAGQGFGIKDSAPSIILCDKIRKISV